MHLSAQCQHVPTQPSVKDTWRVAFGWTGGEEPVFALPPDLSISYTLHLLKKFLPQISGTFVWMPASQKLGRENTPPQVILLQAA